MELSIIIVSWNGEAVIKECLASIYSQKTDFDFEVIVVDNASKDQTKKIIQEEYEAVRLKENEENLGYPLGNNLGLEMALGEYVLLLNQDIVLTAGALQKMVGFLKKNSNGLKSGVVRSLAENASAENSGQIAVVAPQLVYPDGRLQKSLRPFPTPGNVLKDLFSWGRWHENYYDYAKSQVVDQPMASCLLIRKEVLATVGGFDTHPYFFLYFNDTDLSFRIHSAGFQHYYLKDIKVIHHHGESALKWREVARLKAWSQGLYYFLSKHYDRGRIGFKILLGLEAFFIFLARLAFLPLKIARKSLRGKQKSKKQENF